MGAHDYGDTFSNLSLKRFTNYINTLYPSLQIYM